MKLAPLPVDAISDAEWAAGLAVRAARSSDDRASNGLPAHLAAEMLLDAVTGDICRSMRVMVTIDDAYRVLARAQHPAGVEFLGHGSHALPEHHPVDDRTPGAGEPSDPGTDLTCPVERQRSGCCSRTATTTPARVGQKAGISFTSGHPDGRTAGPRSDGQQMAHPQAPTGRGGPTLTHGRRRVGLRIYEEIVAPVAAGVLLAVAVTVLVALARGLA